MRVLLVRHGHAGTKRNWNGDDRLRPLDPPGVAESEALAVRLIPFGPTRIISSPYQRCVESVTPLSAVCARPIERSEALGPEGGEGAKNLVLDLAANGAGTFVVCTHGEVIHYLQTHLGWVSQNQACNFFDDALRHAAGQAERSSDRSDCSRAIRRPTVARSRGETAPT